MLLMRKPAFAIRPAVRSSRTRLIGFETMDRGLFGVFATRFKQGLNGPVFLAVEVPDLLFPLADEPHGHRLHPPRAEAPFHLLPEDGGDEISHEAVQDAPCLLGLVEAPVQLVGLCERRLDGFLGQFIEQYPVDGFALRNDFLGDMPRDGFAFPVRVGPQIDGVGQNGGIVKIIPRCRTVCAGFPCCSICSRAG